MRTSGFILLLWIDPGQNLSFLPVMVLPTPFNTKSLKAGCGITLFLERHASSSTSPAWFHFMIQTSFPALRMRDWARNGGSIICKGSLLLTWKVSRQDSRGCQTRWTWKQCWLVDSDSGCCRLVHQILGDPSVPLEHHKCNRTCETNSMSTKDYACTLYPPYIYCHPGF